MKQYKTYQEAKIENPSCDIYKFLPMDLTKEYSFVASKQDMHGKLLCTGSTFRCNPADYCMTLEQFFEAGHKLVDGDVYLSGITSTVAVVGNSITAENANMRDSSDKNRYILRAKALEKSNPEWTNGDELPPIGVDCVFYPDNTCWGVRSRKAIQRQGFTLRG